jgi:hypothetical protein
MKIINSVKVMAHAALMMACVLACGGCKEKAKSENSKAVEQAGSQSTAKMEAIRQAGYPVTLAELDAWYAEPPAGENGAAAFQQAFAALVPGSSGALISPKDNSKALQLLHQAATGKKCRYPVNLHQGIVATMPYLAKAKSSAQLLEQAAKAQAAGGRMDLAAQSITDAWLLARTLEDEPMLISQYLRIASEILAQRALTEVLSRKALSEAQLASVAAALGESDGMEGIRRAVAGERALCIGFFELPPEKQAKVFAASDNAPKNFSAEVYRKSPAYEADLNFYLDCAEELLAATAMPFPKGLEAASQSADKASEAKSKGLQITAMMLPALPSALERAGEAVANRRVTRAGLAVERYRLAHQNALPETLEQLVPQYLPGVPTDPFDGRPLKYNKESPTGYVIYSIAKNKIDDGGKPREGARDGSYDVAFAVRR